VIGSSDKNTHVAPKEVNPNSLAGACFVFSPSKWLNNKVCHLLVLDVNGLLCEASHLKSHENKWKLIVRVIRCGNKFVSFQPNCCKFLELCSSRFDICCHLVHNHLEIFATHGTISIKGKKWCPLCFCVGCGEMLGNKHSTS